jgi:hypothetical protein
MKLRYKLVIVVVALGALALGAALLTLGAVARGRGVSRVPVPPGSLIQTVSGDADYLDSYAANVPAALFPDSRTLDRFAFQRCTVAGETQAEIMYRGESPGLVYHLSYLRRGRGSDARLYVSTAVHYKNWRGWLYFAFVRPGHRVLAPFMVSVMIRRAQGSATPRG